METNEKRAGTVGNVYAHPLMGIRKHMLNVSPNVCWWSLLLLYIVQSHYSFLYSLSSPLDLLVYHQLQKMIFDIPHICLRYAVFLDLNFVVLRLPHQLTRATRHFKCLEVSTHFERLCLRLVVMFNVRFSTPCRRSIYPM